MHKQKEIERQTRTMMGLVTGLGQRSTKWHGSQTTECNGIMFYSQLTLMEDGNR